MERQLSGSPGLDVSTPPGTTEIGLQLGHSNLYIKNLPATVDEPELWQLFSRCGSIEAGQHWDVLFQYSIDRCFLNAYLMMHCLTARCAEQRDLAHPNLMLHGLDTSVCTTRLCLHARIALLLFVFADQPRIGIAKCGFSGCRQTATRETEQSSTQRSLIRHPCAPCSFISLTRSTSPAISR